MKRLSYKIEKYGLVGMNYDYDLVLNTRLSNKLYYLLQIMIIIVRP